MPRPRCGQCSPGYLRRRQPCLRSATTQQKWQAFGCPAICVFPPCKNTTSSSGRGVSFGCRCGSLTGNRSPGFTNG
eukprot:366028-Chlamydomonas_euryale.AAC.28